MKLSYKGKSAVITGASGGMGLEISKKLSQNDISVLMLDIKSPSKVLKCIIHIENSIKL